MEILDAEFQWLSAVDPASFSTNAINRPSVWGIFLRSTSPRVYFSGFTGTSVLLELSVVPLALDEASSAPLKSDWSSLNALAALTPPAAIPTSVPGSQTSGPHELKLFCVWTSMLKRSIQTVRFFNDEEYNQKQMRMSDAGVMEGLTYNCISILPVQASPHRPSTRLLGSVIELEDMDIGTDWGQSIAEDKDEEVHSKVN